jgi:hypothetical protein
MRIVNLHLLSVVLLSTIPQTTASAPCTQFSPSPIPIQQLPTFFAPPTILTVENLLETESIRQTLSLYAHTIDSRNYTFLSSVFTPDAIANYSASLGVLTGLESIESTLASGLAQFTGTQHLLGSQSIRLCGKDKAISVSYFRAAHFLPRNSTGDVLDVAGLQSVLFAYGQYQDSWVKRGGGWRVAYRNLVFMVSLSLVMWGVRG